MTGIDHHGVGLVIHDFLRKTQNGIRIYSSERDVDDLEIFFRMLPHEAVLQPAVKRTIMKIGIADCGGFAQYKYAKSIIAFFLPERFYITCGGNCLVGK